MFYTARKIVLALVLFTVLPFERVALSEDSSSSSAGQQVAMSKPSEAGLLQCSDPHSPEEFEVCEARTIGELTALGPQGGLIARTRKQTLQILQTSNECSEWFQQVEPDVERVFRSLHFKLDEDGDTEISSTRSDSGERLYKELSA